MRRHIGCHTYRNTVGTVKKQQRKLCWKHGWLHVLTVKVWYKIYRILIQVFKNLFSVRSKFNLRISLSCRRITAHRTKISLSEHQSVAHAPALSHSHHCVINACITVRVELTKHITYYAGRFFCLTSGSDIELLAHIV